MSYDLALFSTDVGTTNKEVAAYYVACCDAEQPDGPPNPDLDRAFAEIAEQYPDLATIPDEDLDDCPWSAGFDKGPRHLVMCMRWSRAEDMARFINRIAARHDVILYDPQEDESFRDQQQLPDSAKRPWWRIW